MKISECGGDRKEPPPPADQRCLCAETRSSNQPAQKETHAKKKKKETATSLSRPPPEKCRSDERTNEARVWAVQMEIGACQDAGMWGSMAAVASPIARSFSPSRLAHAGAPPPPLQRTFRCDAACLPVC